MILAVDVGNTHIVVGCLDREKIYCISRLETSTTKTVDEYAIALKNTLEFNGIDYKTITGAIVSSVVPPLFKVIKSTIKKLIGSEPLIVGSGIKTGMNIAIDNPAQLGGDLVACGVAAIEKYPLPAIIFDMGTASTISVIDEKGNYLGGAIFPGVAISLDALSKSTSQLPRVSIMAPKKCISTNTNDCIQSGAVFGTASMMDGMIDRIEEELGMTATVVATGGLSKSVVSYCKHKIIYDENLLLKGLGVIYYKQLKMSK